MPRIRTSTGAHKKEQAIVAYWHRGWTIAKIARQVSCTQREVVKILEQHGIELFDV